MSMVGGLDLHRRQITYDVLDDDSGEIWRGRLWQPDRQRFRRWLGTEVAARSRGESVALAVEGCTGWRYVVEEISAAGFEPFVAGPEGAIRTEKTRALITSEQVQLSAAGRERIAAGYKMIDAADREALPLKADLQRFGARQPACRALADAQYGIGGLIAVVSGA